MIFPVSRRALAASLAFAFAAPCTFAQTTPTTVVVTATRTPQLASEVLSDIVLIGPEEIARAGAGSVTDLLQRQRGIEVARNGGPGTNSSVFLRGANSNQNIVLVDGVRIGSSTSGAANWSAIPLAAIDHVEIVYGPLSTLYGADAIGGVVQIFTKKGAGAPKVSAFAGAGSDQTRAYDASVAGATGGEHGINYSFSAGKEKSDGFSATRPGNFSYNPDRDGYDRESAAGQFALQLAKGHAIGLVFLHSRLDAQYDGGASAYDVRSRQKLDNLAVYAKNQFLPGWASQVQVAQAQDKSGTDSSQAASGKSRIDTKQTDLSWQNDIKVGSDTLQVLLGHRNEEVLSSSMPVLTRERSTSSLAASYSLKRDRQLASVSLRHDDSSQYGAKTTGAAAYGYRINSALRASASVGTSFRAPTFNELYYPGFGVASNKPESGRNAEGGLYFNDGKSQLSAVYYHNRLNDLLINTSRCPVEPATHPFGCAYNVNQALLEGISLAARSQFGAFNVSGTVDLQDPRDETSGKSLPRRSKKHANLAVEYGAGALTAGVELQLSGQRFDDAANKKTLGGYGLLNLFATYQVAPDWSLLLRWNNATDKQYELARNYATAGATVFAGLRYTMK